MVMKHWVRSPNISGSSQHKNPAVFSQTSEIDGNLKNVKEKKKKKKKKNGSI